MNIVFDLAGVVFEWLPDQLIKSAFSDRKKQNIVRNQILSHPDWLELDRGSLGLKQAISQATQRTGMSEVEITDFFAQVAPSLAPIKDTIELIHEIHERAEQKLYVLSNMHHAIIDYLEVSHDFWQLFESRVISCRIGMVKPESEIFRYLLESNGLVAQETVFIDDTLENVEAAAAHGIKTIHFTSTSDCRRKLAELERT